METKTRDVLQHELTNTQKHLQILMLERQRCRTNDTWYDRQIKMVQQQIKILMDKLAVTDD